MNIINAIYKAPVTACITGPIKGWTTVTIKYNGTEYTGYSQCHPDDMDFLSEKVGKRIARSRARSQAFRHTLWKEERELEVKEKFAKDIKQGAKKDYYASGLGYSINRIVYRSRSRVKALREAIKKENQNLTLYIKSQEEFTRKIRKIRERDKNK